MKRWLKPHGAKEEKELKRVENHGLRIQDMPTPPRLIPPMAFQKRAWEKRVCE